MPIHHAALRPEAELRHRRRLNAIVDTLGFTGDFGDYKHSCWPRFTEFLADHGCTVQCDLFADMGRFTFFGLPSLPKLWGPNRRQRSVFPSEPPVVGCDVWRCSRRSPKSRPIGTTRRMRS